MKPDKNRNPEIFYKVEDEIAYITLNRPKQMNALNISMCIKLQNAIRKCTDDKVLQGYTSGEEAVRKMAEQFEYAVELTYAVFGDDAFQLWKQGEFVGRFNRAIFDVMLYHFWRDEVRKVLQSKSRRGAVKDAFVELCESRPDFIDATEVTTKSIQAVTTRLSLWTQKLKEVLGTDLPTPRLVKGESGRRRIEVK